MCHTIADSCLRSISGLSTEGMLIKEEDTALWGGNFLELQRTPHALIQGIDDQRNS